jgi:pimaricinolide synthase PimS1
MGELPEGGAMLAVEASEEEALGWVEGNGEGLSLAAINGPSSVVLSGERQAIEAAEAHWQGQGQKTKRLAVSHAFHSTLVEPMLEPFAEVARSLSYAEPRIPIASGLSGELLSAQQASDPAYWAAQVRQPVRFGDALAALAAEGAGAFLEIGPDAVLSPMAQEALTGEGTARYFAATMRRGRFEPQALSEALAVAFAAGAELDWEAFFAGTGAEAVALPTYAFQRERYWVNAPAAAGDAGAVGLDGLDHQLLGALIEDPTGEGLTFIGRISLQTHPWLEDHAVFGAVLLPGTCMLELALFAGAQVDAPCVEELTLHSPLALGDSTATQIQVVVGAADPQGRRAVSIYSRPDDDRAGEWNPHASGALSAAPPPAAEEIGAWPPATASPIEIDGLYERLEDLGFDYGATFRRVTGAWQDGEGLYVDVSLAEAQPGERGRFVLHPALTDAAFHPILDLGASERSGDDELPLPFLWRGVHAAAPTASSLRFRIVPVSDGHAVTVSDEAGATVAQIERIVSRPVGRAQMEAALSGGPPLYRLRWDEVGTPSSTGSESVAVLGESQIVGLEGTTRHPRLETLVEAGAGRAPGLVVADFRPQAGEADLAAAAQADTGRALELLRDWLRADGLESSRLLFLTEGALPAGVEEEADLGGAALCGLVRSAQSEHPGRFGILDVDPSDPSLQGLEAALAATSEEPQIALRKGAALVPRLVRAEAGPSDSPPLPASLDSTVLITGGTGGLGVALARHLVLEHGARRLLLVSRSGPDADRAPSLRAELEALGAEVRIVACDVSEREQLKGLLESIPREHPLGAVIHAAGVLDDGLIDSLDRERIERVFAPKATAAWHLHELTAKAELSAFVLFSSAAGVLGAAGQGNYAAANAFLDALARHRQARGLPATALAWGAWEPVGGMTEGLAGADRARLARLGLAPIRIAQGLDLFDLAVSGGEPFAAPLAFDMAMLRAQAKAGSLPPLLGGLVRLPAREADESGALARRLAIVPEAEREAVLLDVVRGHVATVLGYASAHKVETDRAFKDLGFDSLAAVELRNRLAAATGLRLEPTVVFDQPTAEAIAGHLLGELGFGGAPRADESTETAAQRALESVSLAAVEEIDAMDLDDLVHRTLDRPVLQAKGGGE